MTNTDGPRGFSLHKYRREYLVDMPVDSGTATAIFKGDLVYAATDGNVNVMAAQSDEMLGVVVATMNTSNKPLMYLPASTAGIVTVCTDPDAIYIVQSANSGTALTSAAVFDSADPIWDHAGSTTTGQAGVELSETLSGAGSNQFRILGKVDTPDNDWGSNVKLFVTPLEHNSKAKKAAI